MGMRDNEIHDQIIKDLNMARKDKVMLKRMLRMHVSYIEKLENCLQLVYDETIRPEVEASPSGKVATIQKLAIEAGCIKEKKR